MYQAGSVKTMQRNRRGCGDKKGENTKRPADWKASLSNDENKQQFTKLLQEVWSKDSFAQKTLKGRNIFLVCDSIAFKSTSPDDIKRRNSFIVNLLRWRRTHALFFAPSTNMIKDINTFASEVQTQTYFSSV